MMKNEKEKILTYGLTAGHEKLVQERHGAAYEIIKTDCFTDILAIPAEMVVVNPEKMSVMEQKQMNEVFQHDNFTLILFTNEFDKEIMPNLKYWARFEDYMNRARIEGNSFAYVKKLCDTRLTAYFPAGVPAFANERYQQELQYIEEFDGADALRLYYEFSVLAKENKTVFGTRCQGYNLFVRFLLGNSPLDPLSAYRYCSHCGHAEQIGTVAYGIDAPEKNCPMCGETLLARGYSLHPVFVWGSDSVKTPFGVRDEDFKCPSGLYPVLVDRIKELYVGCQVVPWLSSMFTDNDEIEKVGVCVLPKGKDLQKDFPQFVIQDKSGETGMDGWSFGVEENGIQAITLTADRLLDAITEATGRIDSDCIKRAEEKMKRITAEELISTGLLDEEEVAALKAMPVASRFQLTEALAVAINSFGELGNAPWKETPYSLDTEKSFYTRETLYERLLEIGLSEADAFKVTSFVRKGKAYTKFGREKWSRMVKDFSLPEDIVDFCQRYKYLCNRGHVLERLWLLTVYTVVEKEIAGSDNRLSETEDDSFSSFKGLSEKDTARIKAYKGPGIDELIEKMGEKSE